MFDYDYDIESWEPSGS